MTRRLRSVDPNESPATHKSPPRSMLEAAEAGRRDFLMMARKKIATNIDAGVPAHALSRLIAEMDRLDIEIRRLDAADTQDAEYADVGDARFNAAAI